MNFFLANLHRQSHLDSIKEFRVGGLQKAVCIYFLFLANWLGYSIVAMMMQLES